MQLERLRDNTEEHSGFKPTVSKTRRPRPSMSMPAEARLTKRDIQCCRLALVGLLFDKRGMR